MPCSTPPWRWSGRRGCTRVDGGSGGTCRGQQAPRLQALRQPRRARGRRVSTRSGRAAPGSRNGGGRFEQRRGHVPRPLARLAAGDRREARSSTPSVPRAGGTATSVGSNGRETARRFGPSQRWRLASMARSAGVPSLSPPSCWVRSMRSSRNGASTRQRTTRGSSRRRISRWWSARIQWSLQAVAPATRHTYRTLANNFSQANRRVRESAVDPSDSKGGP